MKKLKTFESRTRLVGVPILSLCALNLKHTFESLMNSSSPKWAISTFSWSLVVLVLIIAVITLEWIIEKAIEIDKIREWVLGSDWVEGVWIDFIINRQNNTVSGMALLSIEYQEEGLRILGQSYDCLGRCIGTFESEHVEYDEKLSQARFVFYKSEADLRDRGYAHYDFQRLPRKQPRTFTGWFIDAAAKLENNVEGRKITDRSLWERLNDPDERSAAILGSLQKYLVDTHQTTGINPEGSSLRLQS